MERKEAVGKDATSKETLEDLEENEELKWNHLSFVI
jgi:hypothetical protein